MSGTWQGDIIRSAQEFDKTGALGERKVFDVRIIRDHVQAEGRPDFGHAAADAAEADHAEGKSLEAPRSIEVSAPSPLPHRFRGGDQLAFGGDQ